MRDRKDWLSVGFDFPEYKLGDVSWPDQCIDHSETSWPAMQFNQIWAWPTYVSTPCEQVLGEYGLGGGCNPFNQAKLIGSSTITFDAEAALTRRAKFSGNAAVAFTVANTDADEITGLLGAYPLGGEL